MALPYNIQTKSLLKADNLFIYIVLGLFLLTLISLNYVAGRFSKSIIKLKTITSLVKEDKTLPENIKFPEDELGEIGSELIAILDQKEKSKRALELEREKFLRHFRFSEEGISIFSADRQCIYFNTYFVQYLNLIIDKPILDVNDFFNEEASKLIRDFLDDKGRADNHFSYQINTNGKTLSVLTVVFEDYSFEVMIKNITKMEKTRLLKQEITNNVAHELRTPVTSLRAYLETLNENNLTEEKRKQFINRAHIQSIRLSNLIEDVSMLSKISESTSEFPFEKINVLQLINEVRIDLADKITQNNITFNISVNETLIVQGNHSLLYSIFRNLVDNSISYAGKNSQIFIDDYLEDEQFVYFSYYDTGKGVEEEHLNHLFERFYRVNEGRTRETGASGLGLSIVRNALSLHKCQIQVKNRTGLGLEFLFTLRK